MTFDFPAMAGPTSTYLGPYLSIWLAIRHEGSACEGIAKPQCKVQSMTKLFQSVSSFAICIPIGSMYGIFTYIWFKFMVNVGKYTIHGSYGIDVISRNGLSG